MESTQQGVAGQSGAAGQTGVAASAGAAGQQGVANQQASSPSSPQTGQTGQTGQTSQTSQVGQSGQSGQAAGYVPEAQFKDLQRSYNQQIDALRRQLQAHQQQQQALQQQFVGQLDEKGKADFQTMQMQMQLEQYQQLEQARQRQEMLSGMRQEFASFLHPSLGIQPDEIPINENESRTPTLFVLDRYKNGYAQLLAENERLKSQLGTNVKAQEQSGTLDLGGGSATGLRQSIQAAYDTAMKNRDSRGAQVAIDEAVANRVTIDTKAWRNG